MRRNIYVRIIDANVLSHSVRWICDTERPRWILYMRIKVTFQLLSITKSQRWGILYSLYA